MTEEYGQAVAGGTSGKKVSVRLPEGDLSISMQGSIAHDATENNAQVQISNYDPSFNVNVNNRVRPVPLSHGYGHRRDGGVDGISANSSDSIPNVDLVVSQCSHEAVELTRHRPVKFDRGYVHKPSAAERQPMYVMTSSLPVLDDYSPKFTPRPFTTSGMGLQTSRAVNEITGSKEGQHRAFMPIASQVHLGEIPSGMAPLKVPVPQYDRRKVLGNPDAAVPYEVMDASHKASKLTANPLINKKIQMELARESRSKNNLTNEDKKDARMPVQNSWQANATSNDTSRSVFEQSNSKAVHGESQAEISLAAVSSFNPSIFQDSAPRPSMSHRAGNKGFQGSQSKGSRNVHSRGSQRERRIISQGSNDKLDARKSAGHSSESAEYCDTTRSEAHSRQMKIVSSVLTSNESHMNNTYGRVEEAETEVRTIIEPLSLQSVSTDQQWADPLAGDNLLGIDEFVWQHHQGVNVHEKFSQKTAQARRLKGTSRQQLQQTANRKSRSAGGTSNVASNLRNHGNLSILGSTQSSSNSNARSELQSLAPPASFSKANLTRQNNVISEFGTIGDLSAQIAEEKPAELTSRLRKNELHTARGRLETHIHDAVSNNSVVIPTSGNQPSNRGVRDQAKLHRSDSLNTSNNFVFEGTLDQSDHQHQSLSSRNSMEASLSLQEISPADAEAAGMPAAWLKYVKRRYQANTDPGLSEKHWRVYDRKASKESQRPQLAAQSTVPAVTLSTALEVAKRKKDRKTVDLPAFRVSGTLENMPWWMSQGANNEGHNHSKQKHQISMSYRHHTAGSIASADSSDQQGKDFLQNRRLRQRAAELGMSVSEVTHSSKFESVNEPHHIFENSVMLVSKSSTSENKKNDSRPDSANTLGAASALASWTPGNTSPESLLPIPQSTSTGLVPSSLSLQPKSKIATDSHARDIPDSISDPEVTKMNSDNSDATPNEQSLDTTIANDAGSDLQKASRLHSGKSTNGSHETNGTAPSCNPSSNSYKAETVPPESNSSSLLNINANTDLSGDFTTMAKTHSRNSWNHDENSTNCDATAVKSQIGSDTLNGISPDTKNLQEKKTSPACSKATEGSQQKIASKTIEISTVDIGLVTENSRENITVDHSAEASFPANVPKLSLPAGGGASWYIKGLSSRSQPHTRDDDSLLSSRSVAVGWSQTPASLMGIGTVSATKKSRISISPSKGLTAQTDTCQAAGPEDPRHVMAMQLLPQPPPANSSPQQHSSNIKSRNRGRSARPVTRSTCGHSLTPDQIPAQSALPSSGGMGQMTASLDPLTSVGVDDQGIQHRENVSENMYTAVLPQPPVADSAEGKARFLQFRHRMKVSMQKTLSKTAVVQPVGAVALTAR